MYLQKLNIQGFKSFATKVSLEFKPGITAIVGPNGSGKSNTADAVRWVLGEQSLKSLRGKKSEDVIFAGSDKKTRLGYCQVDLHLNNEDRTAPIDYDEVVISRKVYRDGEGEYFINKHKVRLQDILIMLAKSNFGQRSYSIISQGMVDMFLSATPMQRKEFFDEAAGVRQFQLKKEQAEHKLALTKENLRQAELLIQEIEPRVRSLTRQVHRLERREEILRELKDIQHRHYTGLWHELRSQHGAAEERFDRSEQARRTADKTCNEIKQQMEHLALGDTRQEVFVNLQREYDRVMQEKNRLLREQAVLKGRLEAGQQQRGEADLVWLERRVEQLEENAKHLEHRHHDHASRAEKYEAELKVRQERYEQAQSEHAAVEKELALAKSKLAHKKNVTLPEVYRELEQIFSRQQGMLDVIEQAQTVEDLQGIKSAARSVQGSLGQLIGQLKDATGVDPNVIIRLQDKINGLVATASHLLERVSEVRHQAQLEREKAQLVDTQLSEARSELEKARRELDHRSGNKNAAEISADLRQEQQHIIDQLKNLETKEHGIQGKMKDFNQAEQQKKETVFKLQHDYAQRQEELNRLVGECNVVKVELAKIETRQEDLEKEMVDELSEDERKKIYEAAKAPPAEPELFSQIQHLKRQLELIGGIDPQVAQEYQQTKERYDFLTNQSGDLNKAMTDLEQAIGNLDDTIKQQFNKSFEQINKQFDQYFKMLFNGGRASLALIKEEVPLPGEELEAEDEEEEEAEEKDKEEEPVEAPIVPAGKREKVVTGIDINATPPGKRLRGIGMLSGGERALTSIALICAIIHNNPSPFVVLDEVDAALDETNSIRFATIIEKLAHKTQFIIITHNRATMSKSRILYGVTMGDDGVSKLLSVNIEDAEEMINRHGNR